MAKSKNTLCEFEQGHNKVVSTHPKWPEYQADLCVSLIECGKRE